MPVLDRLVNWIAPMSPPPELEPWVPPALSAAASAAPPGPPTDVPPSPPRHLTAAAAPDRQTPAGPLPLTLQPPLQTDWEDRAWEAYKHLGSARQAVDWLANNASRCHLYIGKINTDGTGDPEPVDDAGVAGEILQELHDGPIGQTAMLKRMARHILVCGATWMAGYPAPPPPGTPAADRPTEPPAGAAGVGRATGLATTPDDTDTDSGGTPSTAGSGDDAPRTAWAVLSRKEWMDAEGGGVRLKLADHPDRGPDGWVTFTPEQKVVLIPIYDPDAQDAQYATSAFEAALKDTDELEGLNKRVAADIVSRLIGNGIGAISESATMPNPAAGEGVNPINGDPFVRAVDAAARTAIQNPESADARLPIWVKVSDESFAGDGPIKHVTFATPFDAQIPVLREAARRALAADLDIPAEVVLGVQDLNHWCVDADTEILTREGWRRHDELQAGDLVLTLDHSTGISEWEAVFEVNRWDVVDEPMLCLDGEQHSSMTTMGHRWPVVQHPESRTRRRRRMVTSEDLDNDDVLILPTHVHSDDTVRPGYEDRLQPVADLGRSIVRYTGTIWCPTTPNGTWLARRKGTVFYTGNSAWAVSEDAIKSHLGPLMTVIVTGLTLRILWPAMRTAGETGVDEVCIWWSASEVAQRPDRSEITLKAHEQKIIGGKAARRELSFDDDDAPEPDELTPPVPPGDGRDDNAGDNAAAGDDRQRQSQAAGGARSNRQPGTGGQARPGNTPNPPRPSNRANGRSPARTT